MRIFRKLSKPLTYLILYCCFCCFPAFADFFPVKFSSKAIASPPEAIDVKNFLIQNISGRSQILPLIGRDSDGTISSFKILSLPNTAAGDLYLNNVAVSINQVITPAQAKQLQFVVKNTFTGTATFNFTVTDNEGLTDASAATYSIPITNNGTLLVCTGGGLGNNILGAKGTFSAPYITPNATISCINKGLNVAAPAQNLGNAPSPAITSYNYASTSGSLGTEGTYSFLKTLGTIAPTERNCIKTDWVASDHTGDGGYAMIVNGSPNSKTFGKTFYQATSMAVCPNTLYEFSAYVINVLPGNHNAAVPGTEPNISFYINTQLVSTSGSIKYSDASNSFVPQWVKVGGLWYSGPNTSVDLRIDNATFVAGGNDLGLDDISLAICGPDISYPDIISLTPKFCSYGVLPLKAEVKASINTYSSYIFQNSTDGGTTWSDLGMAKTGSPVYDSALGTYKYTALYGDIPIYPSMNGYRYRLKVATEAANLTGTTCNISADKIITVSAFDKPLAGADIVGCNSAATAKVIAAGPGETWSALSGNPAAASIDLSGNISGMNSNGIYKFQLINSSGCSDTINVTRDQVANAGTDAYICSPMATYKLADAGTGYKWEKVAGNPADASIDLSTGSISGMIADGTYHFILRSDYGGCTDEVLVIRSNITLSSSQTNINCFGGSTGAIDLSAAGGTAPYTYSWNGGQTTEDLSALAAGTYTVTVKDAKSCTATATITITQPAASLTLSSTQTNINCFGGSTGAIDLSAAGGTAPYTYSWSNSSTSEDLTALTAGTYTVTVTDAKSCTATAAITITQPAAALTLSSSQTNINCFGGSTGAIDLSAAGGTAPYTYSWSNLSTSEDLTGIAAGTYTVTVTDAKSCTATAAITITQPAAALTLSSSQTNINCFGGSTGVIDLGVAGGTAPYSFSWNGGQTTEDLSALAAGTYTVTVTDSKSCTATAAITITQPAAALTLSSSQTNISCFDGSTGAIDLSAAGGTAPYTYSWSNSSTSEDLSSLTAGTYTVTVTDAKSCTATAAITITQPAAALTLSSSQTNINCFGGSTGAIDLSAAGGTAPYTYSWSNLSTNEDLTALTAGTYTVTVTDSKSCTATAAITITQPAAALTLSSSQTNINCFGGSTGAIDLSAAGGTAPYIYSWSTGQSTQDISTLNAGTYAVTVTDSRGCNIQRTFTVREPEALSVLLTVKNATCSNTTNGNITSLISGGKAPYKIIWNMDPTLSSPDLKNVLAGKYEIRVTDANGCSITAKSEILHNNCGPEAMDDDFKVAQGITLTADVSPNDKDPQNEKLSFIKLSDPPHGKIFFNKDGVFSFMPDEGFFGLTAFSYQICNVTGLCQAAKVTITVAEFAVVNLTPELSLVREGRKVSISARLLKPFKEDVTITVAYSGHAEKEKDYLVLDNYQSLTIPKGQISTTQKITIAALTDDFQEGDEDIIMNIKTVSNPDVYIGNGAVAIINDIYPAPPIADETKGQPDNKNLTIDPLLSPNGDGIGNDFFRIGNIELYSDNEVLIFNRWGNELFHQKAYNNADKVFKGYANKGLLVSSGIPLPDGVYFYIVNTYRAEGAERIQNTNRGYLILRR